MYTYTLDEIIHLTSIPKNKAVEVCRLLCSEGYLLFDESSGQYTLTKDEEKMGRLQKIKEDLKSDAGAAEMYSKIQDIMILGKPLALSEIGHDTLVDIGIPGLNIIFGCLPCSTKTSSLKGETTIKSPGLPRGHCILIKGAPGTGKTTLGMQIAVYLENAKYRSLFLTFEEDIDQLCGNLNVYCRKDNPGGVRNVGWDKNFIKTVTRSITKIQTPSAWEDPEIVLQELISILDKELPQLIVVDSISRLRDIGGEAKARPVLRRLIRMLKIRKITAIFLGEDDEGSKAFADYEVDGIIRLCWEGDQLTLSLDKMRGMKSYKGPHSAAMLTRENFNKNEHSIISEENYSDEYKKNPGASYLRPGFNVFPEISLYNELTNVENDTTGKTALIRIGTGISGLDELLKFKGATSDQRGFKQGEAILIIGSAGAGKTLLGLNFMIAGLGEKKGGGNKAKIGVWISLEGDIETLKSATAGFEDLEKQKYDNLLAPEKTSGIKSGFFKFFNFPPLNLDLNKIVYTLHALQGKYEIDRLVIDSITELERAKSGGQPEIKTFLAGLIQYLRDRKITTVFISRSETFFRSIDKLEEQVSSLVDLIICIRNFDMHNQIHKGIYIQKARGRVHNSKIFRMTIDSKKGIDIEDSGWDVENLLAGDTSNIQGPKVFFKLFYENPAEREINEAIIKDFSEMRYPGLGGPTFSVVKKTSIYTEFWSFKGQYSSGHANTRVLSIPDYIINAFRDNNRLAEIDKYVKWEVLQKIENEYALINLYKKKDDTKKTPGTPGSGSELSNLIIDAVPCYMDYGVILYNNELIEENPEANKELDSLRRWLDDNLKKKKSKNDFGWFKWDNENGLLKRIKEINQENKELKPEIIPFAFPPLDKETEFVAFFMELLWSYGGDIFKTAVSAKKLGQPEENGKNKNAFENKIKESIFKEPILQEEHELTKRCDIYKLDQKNKDIEIKKFLDWIRGKRSNDDKNSYLILNNEPFYETIKLMLKMVHWAGVKNPIDGEYRHHAVLSRNWYSQIISLKMEKCEQCSLPDKNCRSYSNPQKKNCMMNHLKFISQKEKCHLLPLPLAEIKFNGMGSGVYRSITCLTYWSLVMLRNALSPEIGGNFIESMNAPEYYEKRLKNKAGMPVTYLEIKKEIFQSFDSESYAILNKIFENDAINDELVKNYTKSDISKPKISEITKDSLRNAFINIDEFFEMSEDEAEEKKQFPFSKDLKKFLNIRTFFSRARQSRTAFYRLEEALHFQLKQLFIGKEFRNKDIYPIIKKNGEETDAVEELITFYKNEKEVASEKDKDVEKYLEHVSKEFRTHIIFELLVYFYNKHLRGEDI